MNVGSIKENSPERRISVTPDTTKNLKDLGLNVLLEKGYGESLGFKDKDYESKGAQILSNAKEVLSNSNLICKVNFPNEKEVDSIKENSSLIISNYRYQKIYKY